MNFVLQSELDVIRELVRYANSDAKLKQSDLTLVVTLIDGNADSIGSVCMTDAGEYGFVPAGQAEA